MNAAQDVEVINNYVKTESNEDFAYVSVSGSVLNTGSGNNKLCKVAPAAGTGFGLLSSPFEDIVSTASWKECQNAKKSAWIFEKNNRQQKRNLEFHFINIVCITISKTWNIFILLFVQETLTLMRVNYWSQLLLLTELLVQSIGTN